MIISSNERPAKPSAHAASIPLMHPAAGGSHSGEAKEVRSLSRHFFPAKAPRENPGSGACWAKPHLVSPPRRAVADLPREDSPSIAVRPPSLYPSLELGPHAGSLRRLSKIACIRACGPGGVTSNQSTVYHQSLLPAPLHRGTRACFPSLRSKPAAGL